MRERERERLDIIASDSWYANDVNKVTIHHSYQLFMKYINPQDNVLELGPAEGTGTAELVKHVSKLTVVEGAELFCDELKKCYPDITVVHSLFEEYTPTEKFDKIILGHVLEHVENPVEILKLVKSWLSDNGLILTAVPNSHSIHRQAAVLMGLLKSEKELNETDKHHGHRRVYNTEEFKQDFLKAGLLVKEIGGYWLKPISNKQLEESWTKEMLDAFMVLGERYPDIAAEMFLIAEK